MVAIASPTLAQKKWLRPALVAVAGLVLLTLAVWGVRGLMSGKTDKPKQQPKLTLIPDRPPPPPPKEEKKPEPTKTEQKEVKMAAAAAVPQPAQNEPLKMEGAAGNGNSPFAAGSVGREYVGGSIGMMGGFYASQLQRHLQEQLNRNRKLRASDYRVTLRVWIGRDGAIQRAELVQTTGNATIDELLKQTLLQVTAMSQAPPENTPQPMHIRVTARGAG